MWLFLRRHEPPLVNSRTRSNVWKEQNGATISSFAQSVVLQVVLKIHWNESCSFSKYSSLSVEIASHWKNSSCISHHKYWSSSLLIVVLFEAWHIINALACRKWILLHSKKTNCFPLSKNFNALTQSFNAKTFTTEHTKIPASKYPFLNLVPTVSKKWGKTSLHVPKWYQQIVHTFLKHSRWTMGGSWLSV